MSLAAVLEAPQTDEVLAARARHGERGAFSTLFLRHQARIYQPAIRISRNCSDAEELTQDTCRRALRGIAIGGALYAATPRVDWASLLRRSFDVDVMQCPKCQGE
jgi:RNA polymerase sigma-70 factor (ECF subfamily)